MNPRIAWCWLLVVTCACEGTCAPTEKQQSQAIEPAAPRVEPVVHHGLAWYEDAPEAALAAARETGRPVFVDLWASWCHTCMSMRSFVLTAERVPQLRDFTLLAVNTEKAENAAFLEKIPVEAWPTFYVLDPKNAAIRGRHVGAASPREMAAFLRDGQRSAEVARGGSEDATDPLSRLLEADRLAAAKRYREAAQAFFDARSKAPADWSRRADALVSEISARYRGGDIDGCAKLGAERHPELGPTVSAADFSAHALSCAGALAASDPRREQLATVAVGRLSVLCETEQAALTADDRSDACALLADAHDVLADASARDHALEVRLDVATKAARGLPDAVARTYDWARVDSLLRLERGREAVTLLKARQSVLKDEPNTSYYLARAHAALGETEAGLTAVERALAHGYGPRKGDMLGLKAELLTAAGKTEAARAALAAQLAHYQSLPQGQRRPAREKAVREHLAKMQP